MFVRFFCALFNKQLKNKTTLHQEHEYSSSVTFAQNVSIKSFCFLYFQFAFFSIRLQLTFFVVVVVVDDLSTSSLILFEREKKEKKWFAHTVVCEMRKFREECICNCSLCFICKNIVTKT